MKYKKLITPPLKEVVFEAFWDLSTDETGFPIDINFDKDLPSFTELIKEKNFPLHKETATKPFVKVFPVVKHQFWKSELVWPLVQLGHGMLTVNDNGSTYIWDETYFPSIISSLGVLKESRSEDLKFNKITVRYINSIDIKDDDYGSFFSDNFKIELKHNYKINGKFKGFQINEAYELEDGSILSFSIQTVINTLNNRNAIVWQIGTEKTKDLTFVNILDWVQFAHEQISNLFVDMLTEKFYASFN